MNADPSLSAAEARRILGVSRLAGPQAVRRAFRDHAKRTHPDRPGGDAAQFQLGLDAFRLLQTAPPDRRFTSLPPPSAPAQRRLVITIAQAMTGGEIELPLGERRLKAKLPPGLRHGDRLRLAGETFDIAIDTEAGACIRGGDLWISADAPGGGRLAVETPLGRRIVWVDRKALERGLLRVPGAGVPARGPHAAGSLYIRLARPETSESPLRQRLRRFADAWAA